MKWNIIVISVRNNLQDKAILSSCLIRWQLSVYRLQPYSTIMEPTNPGFYMSAYPKKQLKGYYSTDTEWDAHFVDTVTLVTGYLQGYGSYLLTPH